jgi:hypothetical protein
MIYGSSPFFGRTTTTDYNLLQQQDQKINFFSNTVELPCSFLKVQNSSARKSISGNIILKERNLPDLLGEVQTARRWTQGPSTLGLHPGY